VEAAAAAAAGVGGVATAEHAQQQQQQQQVAQEVALSAASSNTRSSSGSLGWHLRGRFDQIMQQQQHQQQQQQQVDHSDGAEQQTAATAAAETTDDVAAWLASDSSGSLRSAFTQGWACRWARGNVYKTAITTDFLQFLSIQLMQQQHYICNCILRVLTSHTLLVVSSQPYLLLRCISRLQGALAACI
jgi:hypothetical protein